MMFSTAGDYLTLVSGATNILDVGSDNFSIEFSLYIPSNRDSTTGVILANNTKGGLGVRLGTGYLKDINGISLFARNTADLSYVSYTWQKNAWNTVFIERKDGEISFFIKDYNLSKKIYVNYQVFLK